MLDTYYEYCITAAFGEDKEKLYEVSRRFSQFEELLNLLKSNHPGAFFPHLPEKPLLKNANLIDDKAFIEKREKQLDLLMKKLLSHHAVLGGTYSDSILAMFMDKNYELMQSSKVSKLTKSIVGSAHLSYAKSKNYLKSWFGSSNEMSSLKYEYGGKQPDDLKEVKEFFIQMKAGLDQVLKDMEVIYQELGKSCEALEEQARGLDHASDNESLLAFTKINRNFIESIAETHRKSKLMTEKYRKCIKYYFMFYFEVVWVYQGFADGR